MKKQRTFSDVEYDGRKLVSRREKVLDQMDAVVPWAKLAALMFYFLGARGRPPKGIEIMLRMYFLSVWYNLADEAAYSLSSDSGLGELGMGAIGLGAIGAVGIVYDPIKGSLSHITGTASFNLTATPEEIARQKAEAEEEAEAQRKAEKAAVQEAKFNSNKLNRSQYKEITVTGAEHP